jgi:hypothetical protein
VIVRVITVRFLRRSSVSISSLYVPALRGCQVNARRPRKNLIWLR